MTQSTFQEFTPPQVQPSALQPVMKPSALENGRNDSPNSARAPAVVRSSDAQKHQADATSERATAAFIRRTLCSHNVLLENGEKGRNTPRPIEEVLPPLTSSNEVDIQLYAIISVVVKEFVQTWYSKITPDHVFVNEVIQVIAHCTRALEQRLRKVDLEALLLDEIPGLLEAHVSAFRLAQKQASLHSSLVPDPRIIYHAIDPHPALSPVPSDTAPSSIIEQRENESAWRQLLVQGVLAVLLPTEDLENGCLRALVAEMFAEMIIGNGVGGKACEGWMLWESITKIAEALHGGRDEPRPQDSTPEQSSSRLERYGLLSPALAGQEGPAKAALPGGRRHETAPVTVTRLFWTTVQYVLLACTALRALMAGVATWPALRARRPVEADGQWKVPQTEPPAAGRQKASKRPMVSMRLWSCSARLVELDSRMPWLSGVFSMLQWGALIGPGRVGDTDGPLDRFLSHTMRLRILNPAFLPVLLRAIRTAVFPNNALGPPRPPPSAEETKTIKRRCAATLLALLPARVAAVFFASESEIEQLRQAEELLDCLDDAYLNKHFLFALVELVVVRLIPELGERGVKELLDERLG